MRIFNGKNLLIGIFLAILLLIILLSSLKPKQMEVSLEGNGCLVLAYHRILPSNPLINILYKGVARYSNSNELKLYSILSKDFHNQLKFFKKNNVHFLTLDEFNMYIQGNTTIPDKSVLITFDDVDISVYKNAFPILKKENIPFVIFPITGYVGDADFKGLHLSDWNNIQEMLNSGLVAIGTHTHSLHYLDKDNNPPFLNADKKDLFRKDISLSMEAIKVNTGKKTKYFSYPYGHGIYETDKILSNLGIELIFTLGEEIIGEDYNKGYIKRLLLTQYVWDSVADWVKK